MNHLRHQNSKNKYSEIKYLNNIRRNIILKMGKDSLSELEEDFKELRYWELKYWVREIWQEKEELF